MDALKDNQIEIPKFDMQEISAMAKEISESVDEIEKMDTESSVKSNIDSNKNTESNAIFIDTNTGREISYEAYINHPYPQDIKIITDSSLIDKHINETLIESKDSIMDNIQDSNIQDDSESIILDDDSTMQDSTKYEYENIESNLYDSIEIKKADKEAFKKGIKQIFKFYFMYKNSEEKMNDLDELFMNQLAGYIEDLVKEVIKENLQFIINEKLENFIKEQLSQDSIENTESNSNEDSIPKVEESQR